MKMYKKVMAAALAGAMTVSMSATAFAADDDCNRCCVCH